MQHRLQEDSSPSAIIEVTGLHKLYQAGESRVHALRGVSFSIAKGEFCSIVGASGSGKSTLLNLMAGLESPTRGEIRIEDKFIEKMNENQRAAFRRARVGFVFQSFNLLPMYTAWENVALPLVFKGVPVRERKARALAMLKLVGLLSHAQHKPSQLSGGQQQRVGIARALVVNPAILFADEPTGNLDSVTGAEVMAVLRRAVTRQGCTLIMVTHDPGIAALADRSFHLKDGRITAVTVKKEATLPEEDMIHEA